MLDAIRSALSSISSNKVRSVLTVLGVVIGVSSVTTLVAMGQGLKNDVSTLIQGFGTNVMFVVGGKIDTSSLSKPGGGQQVNPADLISGEVITPADVSTAKGLEALRAKSKWWNENHTVHSAETFGPYPHDDRFAVRFLFDITHKPSGKRMTMDEVGLFTVKDGKITREEFFYTAG